ncbi:hypothetical protein NX059_002181 [Plenodomus lindquistii]|nr:hypothetical protein NX059_002181 [Plenodomus lindquistii]
MNAQFENALESVADQRHLLEFEVFAPFKALQDTIGRAKMEKDAVVRVQVYVYGSRKAATEVGEVLAKSKLYLQKAMNIRDDCTYENPQLLPLVGYQNTLPEMSMPIGEAEVNKPLPETLNATVTEVFSNLTRGERLRGMEGDERLQTTLLLHQKKALRFMTEREDGPVPEEYQLWIPTESDGVKSYRHAVTKTCCMFAHTETGGGILADEMGMGKSLSILALVLRTLDVAQTWASCSQALDENRDHWKQERRARATLIVAPSEVMINGWFQELEKHFDPRTCKALTTLKHHGPNRESSIEKLCEADIIITTYHTLASDFAGVSHPFRNLHWYRLVLDEAHMIRRQSTLFYRTVAEVTARSRWCLTGTPIQNRLEDIGSLFAFLRINPFQNISVFRKYIVLPFEEGGRRRELAVERFARLLDSLCLRQTKDVLQLPDQLGFTRTIELSSEERAQYDHTHNTMFRAISNQNGLFDQKSTLGMFQVQLQLRIICNHGTWQQPFSWNRRKLHLLDEIEARENSLGRNGEITCSACRQTMPLFSTGSLYKRYDEQCQHILCVDCLTQTVASAEESFPIHCPLCAPLWQTLAQAHDSRCASREDLYFQANGRSTKMEALMHDVLTNITTTKSIIFTCWTRTLDLLQIYFSRASLSDANYRRIDGDCPTAKRERIFREFASDPGLHILIMTTGTGAVGLNLATANRVFIVEPQWNPSVENQAIARALRLGQTHSVLVTRYVVDQTVEQGMRALQESKLERADLVKKGNARAQ